MVRGHFIGAGVLTGANTVVEEARVQSCILGQYEWWRKQEFSCILGQYEWWRKPVQMCILSQSEWQRKLGFKVYWVSMNSGGSQSSKLHIGSVWMMEEARVQNCIFRASMNGGGSQSSKLHIGPVWMVEEARVQNCILGQYEWWRKPEFKIAYWASMNCGGNKVPFAMSDLALYCLLRLSVQIQ